MARTLKVALAQMDIAWLDTNSNLAKIARFIEEAKIKQAAILLLPEMALSGFCMEPEKASVTLDSPEVKALMKLTEGSSMIVVCGAAIVSKDAQNTEQRFTNRALILQNGKLLKDYSKINLFSFSGEHKVYASGEGPILFEHEGLTFCPLICYDLRFPELFLSIAKNVTGAFLVIANWPESRSDHWKTLMKARALDSQTTVVAVNRVGQGGSLKYSGDSAAFNSKGEALIPFATGATHERLLIAELDPPMDARFRKTLTVLEDREKLVAKLSAAR